MSNKNNKFKISVPSLNYLMDHIMCQMFKITLDIP